MTGQEELGNEDQCTSCVVEAYSADWQHPVSLRSPFCELRALPASCQEPLPFAACVPEEKEHITSLSPLASQAD